MSTSRRTAPQRMYDDLWNREISQGKDDMGDLHIARRFLDTAAHIHPASSVLEIGCGAGKLLHAMGESYPARYCGIDAAFSALRVARQRGGARVAEMDADNLALADQSFDLCYSFDLVEHLPVVGPHLREIFRVLKSRGAYLIGTPNILSNLAYELFKHDRYSGYRIRDFHPSLQFPWTLRRHLTRAGFVDIRFHKIPPVSDYKAQDLHPVLRPIFRCIPWRVLPVFLQIGFFVAARKP